MTNLTPEVELMIGVGGTFKRVPLVSIAASTRLPTATLRESLSRLFFALLDRSDESVPQAEGEMREGESGTVRSESVSVPTVSETERKTVLGTEPSVGSSDRSDADARDGSIPQPALVSGALLADALADPDHLPFYDQLVRTTPPAVLAEALDETLRRRSLIRGRPGAYFTALVRRLSQRSYAPPSTPTPT